MISVIVAVYNVKEYLENCIESIIKQTYNNIEIILIDDGSYDGSEKICDRYADIDSRIKVIHQQNQGFVRTRKAGLKIATGDYIIFVDGDDSVKFDLCEHMLMYILENDADVVHSNYYINGKCKVEYIRDNMVMEFNRLTREEKEEILIKNVLNCNENHITPSIWSKIFKAELIRKCYENVDDNCSYGEDIVALFHVIMKAKRCVICKDGYYNYTQRDESMSHTFDIYNLGRIANLYYQLHNISLLYGCTENLEYELKRYYRNNLLYTLKKMKSEQLHFNLYKYPNINIIRGKNIIIYGAGNVGVDYYNQICRYSDINIVAWVDKQVDKYKYDYCEIQKPDDINLKNVDYIVVAVYNKNIYYEIEKELIKMGWGVNRILWEKPEEVMELPKREDM